MADLKAIYTVIDQLDPQELFQLRDYVERRTQQVLWVLKPEHLQAIDEAFRPVQEAAAHLSEDEINRIIDEAVSEVRRERKAHPRGDYILTKDNDLLVLNPYENIGIVNVTSFLKILQMPPSNE